MMRAIKGAVIAFAVFMVGMGAYTGAVIVKARAATPGIVRAALAAPDARLRPADLSPWQLKALLAVEDPAFFQHRGVDLRTPGAGITTITQALVKHFYFKRFTPGLAKYRQTLIARFALDPLASKSEQLALFLNYAYLGQAGGAEVRGFAAAAQAYYRKPFSALNEDEYLGLVAMLIAPRTFNVATRPAVNAERVRRIRKLLDGTYRPQGLRDVYYGPLDPAERAVLPAASYDPTLYAGTGKE